MTLSAAPTRRVSRSAMALTEGLSGMISTRHIKRWARAASAGPATLRRPANSAAAVCVMTICFPVTCALSRCLMSECCETKAAAEPVSMLTRSWGASADVVPSIATALISDATTTPRLCGLAGHVAMSAVLVVISYRIETPACHVKSQSGSEKTATATHPSEAPTPQLLRVKIGLEAGGPTIRMHYDPTWVDLHRVQVRVGQASTKRTPAVDVAPLPE